MWKVKTGTGYTEKYQVLSSSPGGKEIKHGEYHRTTGDSETSGTYENGKKDGEWVCQQGIFTLDAEKKFSSRLEQNFQNGKLEGELRQYVYSRNINGWQLSRLETYKNGRLEGSFCSYRRDGTLDIQGQYENGMRQGKWIRFLETGKQKRYYWNNYFLLDYSDRYSIPSEFRVSKIKTFVPEEHRPASGKDHEGPWLEIYVGKDATRLPLHPCKEGGNLLRKNLFAQYIEAGGW